MRYQETYFLSRKKLSLSRAEFELCRVIDFFGTTDYFELSNHFKDDPLINLSVDEFESTLNGLDGKGFITKVVNPARTLVGKLFSDLFNSDKFGYSRVRTVTQEISDICLSEKGVQAFKDNLEYVQGGLNFWAGYSS